MSDVNVGIDKVKGLEVVKQYYYPPRASSGESRDITEIIELIDLALEDFQKGRGTPKDKQLKIRWAYAKEFIEQPGKGLNLVVMKIAGRQYGNMSPDRQRRPWKPQHRETRQHPDYPDKAIIVESVWLETMVEFKIMTPDCSKLQDLALLFEDFMDTYRWFFLDQGIQHLQFVERKEDTVEEIGGTELYVAPFKFMYRFERIYHSVKSKIKKIRVQYDVGAPEKVETTDEELGIQKYSINRGS